MNGKLTRDKRAGAIVQTATIAMPKRHIGTSDRTVQSTITSSIDTCDELARFVDQDTAVGT